MSKKCNRCGYENQDEAKYCNQCGSLLGNAAEEYDTIYNLIILDESGSMISIRRQAINGFNETVQTIKAAQRKYSDSIISYRWRASTVDALIFWTTKPKRKKSSN
jgi:uncharacterized membrane protein YvbJ